MLIVDIRGNSQDDDCVCVRNDVDGQNTVLCLPKDIGLVIKALQKAKELWGHK